MKKLFAVILTVALLMSLSVTAFAANTTGGDADITTSIAPTYTVTIPADVNVAFNATETAFGAIEVTASQIHPNKCIKVELTSDGKLENSIDATKVIPYAIKDGNALENDVVATFTTDKAEQTATIHIAANDPDFAGDYKDTVTFTLTVKTN